MDGIQTDIAAVHMVEQTARGGYDDLRVLLELIDTTIKSDEDLSEIYKIPVFAEIPDFNTGGK